MGSQNNLLVNLDLKKFINHNVLNSQESVICVSKDFVLVQNFSHLVLINPRKIILLPTFTTIRPQSNLR